MSKQSTDSARKVSKSHALTFRQQLSDKEVEHEWCEGSFGQKGQWMGSQEHAGHPLAERWAGTRYE